MKLNELKCLNEFCKKIGIKTFDDLQRFKEKEVFENETLLEALERYAKELGKEFQIKEN